MGVFSLNLFPFLYKYFLELSIFLVPVQAQAVLEKVLILEALCLARYELPSPKQRSQPGIFHPHSSKDQMTHGATSRLPSASPSTHNISANTTNGFMGMVGVF